MFQILEALNFAWQALRANLLRTVLSLLGVTIGIFSIVGVTTMVDSLEKNIKESLASIGSNVIYIEKWPWIFAEDYPWWKYFKRPMPNYNEYKYLKENLESASHVVMLAYDFGIQAKRQANSIETICQGVTYEFSEISDVPISAGRYFLPQEIEAGRNVAIIGDKVVQSLFPGEDPIGKLFKVKGLSFICIGTIEKKGEQIADVGGNPDEKVLMPLLTHKKLFSSGFQYGIITIKGYESDTGLHELAGETTGLMRTKRGLRPSEEDDFSLNRPEAAVKAIGQVFSTLRVAGYIIGMFALLIGGFGIANIMFVSVKERTNIIGIQKSLGAKNHFILFQFLFESVFLCLIGGLFGVLIVYLFSFIPLGPLDLVLSADNIVFGVFISTFIGIVSGIVPAYSAAKMDPVEAIRSK